MKYKKTTKRMVNSKIRTALSDLKKTRRRSDLSRRLANLDINKPQTFANGIDSILRQQREDYFTRIRSIFELIEAVLLIEPIIDYKEVDPKNDYQRGILEGQLTYYNNALTKLNEYKYELLEGEWK